METHLKSLFLLSAVVVLAATPALAHAEEISNFNAVLTAASPTELGRPSRSGIQQTWTGAETWTGIINPTTAYAYTTYTFAASNFVGAPYVEITALDTLVSNSDFVVAYAGSYNVASPSTNWLGDQGSSGNFFGATDGRYFDIFLPVGKSLVLVVNNTAAAGLNDPINIDVSAYADTMYTEPVAVTPPTTVTPEPSAFVLLGTGLLTLAGTVRRRLQPGR